MIEYAKSFSCVQFYVAQGIISGSRKIASRLTDDKMPIGTKHNGSVAPMESTCIVVENDYRCHGKQDKFLERSKINIKLKYLIQTIVLQFPSS